MLKISFQFTLRTPLSCVQLQFVVAFLVRTHILYVPLSDYCRCLSFVSIFIHVIHFCFSCFFFAVTSLVVVVVMVVVLLFLLLLHCTQTIRDKFRRFKRRLSQPYVTFSMMYKYVYQVQYNTITMTDSFLYSSDVVQTYGDK